MDKFEILPKLNEFNDVINVDKAVDKKGKFRSTEMKKIVKKPKILRINLDEAVMEGNLIEMPFVTYNLDRKKKDIVSVVEYKWIDSKGINRGIEIRGSAKYGVPTSFEFDVLIALLRIYARSEKILLNAQYINDYNISEDDITIEFTLTKVAEELGLNRPSSTILNKILRSIEILTDTTIYNRYSGGIYDILEQKYIEDKAIAFHIVEKFESTLYRNDKKQKRGRGIVQKIKLNKFFYKSISGGYLKFYSHTEYVGISSSIGRRLFLILSKWKGDNKSYLKIKNETLYQRIPLEDSIPIKRKNQMIKRALQSLIDIGFIKQFEIKDGYVTSFFKIEDIKNNDDNIYFKNKYNHHDEIIDKLKSLGFTEEEIQRYLNVIYFDNEYAKALLRYAEIQDRYGKIDSMKGFVLSGFVKKYNIDNKYYN